MLDEADEMLSRGFKDQIYDVFRKMPSNIQVVLLSATMPLDVLDVTQRFMRDPIRILVKKEELTLEGIKQFYVQVEKEVRMCVWGILCTNLYPLVGCMGCAPRLGVSPFFLRYSMLYGMCTPARGLSHFPTLLNVVWDVHPG